MTVAAAPSREFLRAPSVWGLAWIGLLVLTLLLALDRTLVPWASDYPASQIVPIAEWTSAFMAFLKANLTWATRLMTDVLAVPLDLAFGLLSKGFKLLGGVIVIPRFSWLGVTLVAAITGYALGGWRLAALAGACFLYIAFFGQWESAMRTLALIVISVPLCILVGGAFGILAYRKPAFDRLVITPVLDLMQTMPTFAYLIPMLLLFGNSPVSAMIATAIFATPPMVRATTLALGRVPAEIDDFGEMVGCTKRQKLWRVLMPSARPTLMIGVNQVIMLALNMVIIASMIGAGGLGFDVLAALRRLDFGTGLEAGFAIVALAIALDRLSQAYARKGVEQRTGGNIVTRHPYLFASLTIIFAGSLAGLLAPGLQTFPEAYRLTTGPFWSGLMEWINVNYFDTLEAMKNAVLTGVLIPVRRFMLALPWLGVVAFIAAAGWHLGGARLAALAGALSLLIAVTGQWEKAMITVYLCGISTVIAMAIGIPIGIAVAERQRLWRGAQAVIDTLQTLPSFVYLMPAVMLFRVGDFTAMLAVVAFAIVPAIRYTVLGLQGVDPRLIEAGRAMGCSEFQILTRIRLRLALPEILLGLNQTIMFALSMLVITALVGTRDLGQEVYIALTKADPGRGLVAGLAIAFIAIIADRLIQAAAARQRAQLGLSEA